MADPPRLPAMAMRTVLASGRLGGRAGGVLHGGLSALWLGALGEGALRELDERFYLSDPTYRTAGWNERGLWDWERDALAATVPDGGRVAVVACGGGREVLALLRAGYDAVGYESHPALAAYAETFLAERGFPDRVHQVARDEFPPSVGFDGVLVGWGGLSLIAPRARRISFLAGAGAATAPAGAVIVSVFCVSEHGRRLRATARAANLLRRARGSVPVELGDTMAPNRVHVFTREELESELVAAGLVLGAWKVVGPSQEAGIGYACAVGGRA